MIHAACRTDFQAIRLLSEAGLQDKSVYSTMAHEARWKDEEAVRLLVEANADINCQIKDGSTALHISCQHEHGRMVDLLMKHGADTNIKNKKGRLPEHLASAPALKKIFRKFKFAVLYAEGTVPLKVMKLCLVGAGGAGKTTFLRALRRGFLKRIFTRENERDEPERADKRTVGIDVTTVNIPGVGRWSLYDHAGQKQFHKTHCLFFRASNSLFILLLSLVEGGQIRTMEELTKEAQYWLSFLRCSLEPEFIPTVIVVGSRADYFPESHWLLQRVVSKMQLLFDDKVKIADDSFLLDCRKSRSTEMARLRSFLKKTRHAYLQETTTRYPRVCAPVISRLLPSLRRKEEDPFMEKKALVLKIQLKKCPELDSAVLDKVVEFLDETGEVIVVGEFVSLNPSWLCQYALGPIIAPEEMHWAAGTVEGRLTKEEAEIAINEYLRAHKIKVTVKIDTVLKMLLDLGLAFMQEDGSYMVPARLLPLQQWSEMWNKEKDKKVYVGRRKRCSDETSIFTPGSFSLFQCQICIQIDKQAVLWRDGIILSKAESIDSHVQCIARMVDPLRAVDIVARGPEGSELQCKSLLDHVANLWKDTIEKHSPGTKYETEYLSRKHLSEHREQILVYKEEEIIEAKTRGPSAVVKGRIGSEELVESLQDLLVLTQLQVLPLQSEIVKSILRLGCDRWYALGIAMELSDGEINAVTSDKPCLSDKLLAIINLQVHKVGLVKTEEILKEACQKIHFPIYSAVIADLEFV
jgi:death-associated protein kinase